MLGTALAGVICCMAAGSAQAAIERFAVVVGNNLGSAERVPLRYAEMDARKLATVLLEVGGLSRANLRQFFGRDLVTVRQGMRDVSAELARRKRQRPQEQQVLFFFFSGHSDGRFLELGSDRLSFAELRRWTGNSGADVKLVVLDTCKSGSLLRTKGGAPAPRFDIKMDDRLRATGEAILTSAAADEQSLESDTIRGSFFSHSLVSGLRGAADTNADGRVTLTEAYTYAAQATRSATAGSRYGTQHPEFAFRLSGSGELGLSDLGGVAGRIRLPAGFDRIYLVRVGVDQVLAEVSDFGPGRTLAVRAGVYGLRAWKKGRFFAGDLVVESGREHAVTAETLSERPAPKPPQAQNRPAAPWRLGAAAEVALATQTEAPLPPRRTNGKRPRSNAPGRLRAFAEAEAPTPQPTGGCAYRCQVDLDQGTSDCAGPVRRLEQEGPRAVYALAMAGFSRLELEATACAPRDYVLLVADSPGCDGGGGDNRETFYDAEVEIRDQHLSIYANDLGARPPVQRGVRAYFPATGCATRTLHFADGWFFDGQEPAMPLRSPALLRLDPPPAGEGVPDSLWYVGMNRTVLRADRTGEGLRQVRFCLRR